MTKRKGNLGWTRKDFQNFLRKGGKGVVKSVVGLFPSNVFSVPGRTSIQQDIVVADGVGLDIVKFLAAISTNGKFFRVDRLMLHRIGLVRALLRNDEQG